MTVSDKNNYNDFRFIITISLFPVQCLCSSFMGVSRKTFGFRRFGGLHCIFGSIFSYSLSFFSIMIHLGFLNP